MACVSRKADGVACGLRLASRTAILGTPPLLRQCRDVSAHSVATASATYARKPHHPPSGEVVWMGEVNARVRRTTDMAICDLPSPKRPFSAACLGQLYGDHFVKTGTSNWPTEAVRGIRFSV